MKTAYIRQRRFLFYFFITISFILIHGNLYAAIWYVDGDVASSGNGRNWSEAFKTVHEAVNIAIEGDEIWVKKGTYAFSSTLETMNKVSSTTVTDSVWVCVAFNHPNSKMNVAELEKLNSTRGVIETAIVGNEIRVRVESTAPPPTINLDKAFNVYGGFAGWESQKGQRDWENNVTLLDGQGQSLFYVTADATIDGFTITNGGGSSGVAIFNFQSSSPTIRNCRFINDHNTRWVAIRSVGSSPTIANCLFSNMKYWYGPVANFSSSPAIIVNCTFDRCSGGDSNAILNYSGSDSIITDCFFTNNSGATSGGAIYNWESSPTITGSIFHQNHASDFGGAIYNATGSFPSITNCVFYGNNVGVQGGGAIANDGWGHQPASSPTIINSTFYDNWCRIHSPPYPTKGGAIYSRYIPSTITNSIFWNNSAAIDPEIHDAFGGVSNVTYSNIQGGYPGEGNIDADPLFVDPDNEDFHLSLDSPCIDTGTSIDAPDDDIDGDLRPQGAGYDIGADEYVCEINIEAILEFFYQSVKDETIKGRGKIPYLANFRLWLFRQMLETAKSFIEKEKMNYACRTLNRVFLRCDSEPKPKDFIKGEAVPELADMILVLMESFGCE